MSNRISQYFQIQRSTTKVLCRRPILALNFDRPISVDMERFFDFSFSFAEALLDLEDKYQSQKPVVSVHRELSLGDSGLEDELEFDIDARWM